VAIKRNVSSKRECKERKRVTAVKERRQRFPSTQDTRGRKDRHGESLREGERQGVCVIKRKRERDRDRERQEETMDGCVCVTDSSVLVALAWNGRMFAWSTKSNFGDLKAK
jgi:hypothetical protein